MKFLSPLIIFVANIFLFNEVKSCFRFSFAPAIDYDMLVVAQTWPQTACWVINDKWEYDRCSPCTYTPKSSTKWTMHGLWPSKRNGDHPFYCDETKKFDEKLLSRGLLARLREKWPTFNLQSNDSAFWEHEWDKHGTCASGVESANTVPKYFARTLELLDAYNVGDLLERAGIVPRTEGRYNIEDVARAIEGALGVHVTISCAANEAKRTNYLDQIYMCFDKSLRLTDCELSTKFENCSYGKQVIYPEILKPC